MDDFKPLSKHELREQKRQKIEEVRESEESSKRKKQLVKKLFLFVLVLFVIIIGIIFVLNSVPKPVPQKYNTDGMVFPTGVIHWHATPIISVCGTIISLPDVAKDEHLGSELLHTHEDKLIHVEGNVNGPSEITLGQFMSNIGMNFSSTYLLDKNNGAVCQNGNMGKVVLIINGSNNNEFENYVVRDDDVIEMRFE